MQTRYIPKKLTQKRLKELLCYYPLVGTWIRIVTVKDNEAIAGDIAGYINEDGYRRICVDGKYYLSSRLAFLYMEGYFPEHEADHKNRIRHDDKWSNLREATRLCNMRNKSKYKNNKSGITGVCWNKKNKKWTAYIRINKKQVYRGTFKTKESAAKERWAAEKEYGFPNCNTTSSSYLYLETRGLVND